LAIVEKEVETRQEKAPREGTLSQKIVEYIVYMQKQGRAESTIEGKVKMLKRLSKLGAELYDPESVKLIISQQPWVNGRKELACDAYSTYLHMTGGKWERPTYERIDKDPYIPQPTEVKQLIAGCSQRMGCFLQTIEETAMRPGELWIIPWKDYDQPTRTIRVTPEKGSNSGTYKRAKELAAMLDALPHIHGDGIFSTPDMDLNHHRRNFEKQRKRIARNLKNPRIQQISFRTLRHYKATMEAFRTRDPFHVQKMLRHRNIKNTMIYIHLAEVLFKGEEEFISKVATNVNEARVLVEQGFKYITGEYDDGGKIFAKPKDPTFDA
jgi:integrase